MISIENLSHAERLALASIIKLFKVTKDIVVFRDSLFADTIYGYRRFLCKRDERLASVVLKLYEYYKSGKNIDELVGLALRSMEKREEVVTVKQDRADIIKRAIKELRTTGVMSSDELLGRIGTSPEITKIFMNELSEEAVIYRVN